MRRLTGLGVLLLTVAGLLLTAGPAWSQSPNGSVTATVQVRAAACITVAPSTFSYAPAVLSTASGLVTTTPNSTRPVATNCSSSPENFLARGGTATGSGATWDLVSSLDCGGGGTNQYRHDLKPASTSYAPLQTTDQTWETGVAASGTSLVDTRLTMPCTGSNGVGQTMSLPIVITAVVQ